MLQLGSLVGYGVIVTLVAAIFSYVTTHCLRLR